MNKLLILACVACLSGCANFQCQSRSNIDAQLSSWSNDGVRKEIVGFIEKIDDKNSNNYVPPNKRIAVFDLDGTLVSERPHYFEVSAATKKLIADANSNPDLRSKQPYKAAIENDDDYIGENGEEVVMKASENELITDFQKRVSKFMQNEHHPKLHIPYDYLFYKPMKELISTLKSYGFKVYIVSTSQQEYVRAFSENCLGIGPENVIGTMVAFEAQGDVSNQNFIQKNAIWEPHNANIGKVYRIRERTGALPVFAFGNSSGDKEMLEITSSNPISMSLLLDHDDSIREYEYHSKSMIDEAEKRGWKVVSIKNDFKEVFTNKPCAP